MRILTWYTPLAFAMTGAAAQRPEPPTPASWQGMMGTPVGAFPAIETAAIRRGDPAFAVHFSTRKLESASGREHSYGVSAYARGTPRLRTRATMGWTQGTIGTASANGGIFQVGVELAGTIWQTGDADAAAFIVGWKGTGGVGHLSGIPEGNVWSLAAHLPLTANLRMANRSDWSAYVSPGFGYGATGDTGAVEEEAGTQPIISLGGAWTSPRGPGIHLGVLRLPADLEAFGDSPWVAGVSLSVPLGGGK